jgi:hypothetical protein
MRLLSADPPSAGWSAMKWRVVVVAGSGVSEKPGPSAPDLVWEAMAAETEPGVRP